MKLFPGVTFSWHRLLGIQKARARMARATGVPTTKAGVERKLGRVLLGLIFGKRRRRH